MRLYGSLLGPYWSLFVFRRPYGSIYGGLVPLRPYGS